MHFSKQSLSILTAITPASAGAFTSGRGSWAPSRICSYAWPGHISSVGTCRGGIRRTAALTLITDAKPIPGAVKTSPRFTHDVKKNLMFLPTSTLCCLQECSVSTCTRQPASRSMFFCISFSVKTWLTLKYNICGESAKHKAVLFFLVSSC